MVTHFIFYGLIKDKLFDDTSMAWILSKVQKTAFHIYSRSVDIFQCTLDSTIYKWQSVCVIP